MSDLSKYTSLRVGGPAKKIIHVSSEKEIIDAIEQSEGSPILILGERLLMQSSNQRALLF